MKFEALGSIHIFHLSLEPIMRHTYLSQEEFRGL